MKKLTIILLTLACLLGPAVAYAKTARELLAGTSAGTELTAVEQYKRGVRYEKGEGVERDLAEAFRCYQKAAEQDFTAAQYALGNCYRFGRGVGMNLRKAVHLYDRAAKKGNTAAQNALDAIYDEENIVRSWDLVENARMVGACNSNDAGGQCYVGKSFLYGRLSDKKNPQEAVRWLKKSAEQGFAEAQYRLADCYMYGRGTEKNAQEAFALYTEAAESGLDKAMTELAKCYLYGKGVAQDKNKGYYLLPSDSDLKEAKYTRAKCLLYGWGCEQDKDEAKQILRKLGDYRGADKLLKQL